MKKLLSIILAASACAFLLVGCVPDEADDGVNTYTFEAEYIDLDNVQGSGISSDQGGVEMIYGDGTQAQKDMGWSGGYFVGFTYNAGLTLDFVFESDQDAKATVILRLGSELGELNLNSTNFEVQVNGKILRYSGLTVANSSLDSMKFYDKTVSTNAKLVKGTNTISIVILDNDFCGSKAGGPCVDCIKVSTEAKLTWKPKTDNPDRRGAIV